MEIFNRAILSPNNNHIEIPVDYTEGTMGRLGPIESQDSSWGVPVHLFYQGSINFKSDNSYYQITDTEGKETRVLLTSKKPEDNWFTIPTGVNIRIGHRWAILVTSNRFWHNNYILDTPGWHELVIKPYKQNPLFVPAQSPVLQLYFIPNKNLRYIYGRQTSPI